MPPDEARDIYVRVDGPGEPYEVPVPRSHKKKVLPVEAREEYEEEEYVPQTYCRLQRQEEKNTTLRCNKGPPGNSKCKRHGKHYSPLGLRTSTTPRQWIRDG